ncbi:gap junction beta-4 protein-like [Sardina pilchardus]|uniref:gap junction beta-4 protein-like n=1 Tax=Sardina pilchardus TaxID=27697 RepID=UPI002E137DA5
MTLDIFKSWITGIFKYSTMLSKVWLLVYVYRVLVYFVVAQYVWIDKTRNFECVSTIQGCTSVCYDHYFSISPSLLWALQLIFIICPSLLVVGHVKWREQKDLKYIVKHRGAHLYTHPGKKRGGLWWMYLLSLVLRAGFDAGFLCILRSLYSGYDMPKVIRCDLTPCQGHVECYVTRPTEKKIFTLIMVVSACIGIVICICEMVYLIHKRIRKIIFIHKRHRQDFFAESHELGEIAPPRTSRYRQVDPTFSRPPYRGPSRAPSRTSVQNPHNPTTSSASKARQTYL